MSASMTSVKKIQNQGLLSSSLSIDEETMLMQKQGIGTILGSDCERDTASASSLRRTLSADMSSKEWLSQSGSSPMKKIASSERISLSNTKNIAHSLSFSSSSSEGQEEDYEEKKELEAEEEAERERLEIWSSIQKNKEKQEKAGQFDTWSSIMSLKAKDDVSKSLPVTPYIHPLVKRSKSTLSEKSLEICTESLGSETGSDGFSSYPPSETGDAEEDKEEEQQLQLLQQQEEEKVTELAHEPELELQIPGYNQATATKKSPPRSFPPPLPSLFSHQHGPSLHMRFHRDNGRLVLQAVSLPSQNNFRVQRQDGRLVLTFANHQDQEEEDADEVAEEEEENDAMMELDEEFGAFEEDDQEEKEYEGVEVEFEDADETDEKDVEETECVLEKAPLLSSGITTTSVHGLALVRNKPIGLVSRNPKWSEKLNQVVNFDDVNGVVEVEPSPVAKSLPPRPKWLIPKAQPEASAAAAASFNSNAYEYYWRTKPGPVPDIHAYQQNNNSNNSSLKNNNSSKATVSGDINPISNEQQKLLVLKGKNGDHLVPNLKSCKNSRRSFLFWEPFCIATS